MSAPKSKQARSVARLAAIQALYQMEVSGVGAEAVIREFTEHRFDRDLPMDTEPLEAGQSAMLASADEAFFADLVRGVVDRQGEIDNAIAKRLATGWRLERLDATVRAMLRAGAYELAHRPDVPTEVAIDEYVELAKSFFEGPEPGFVNGALDAVAQDVRS
jgi:transcription antitermination protein NusB